MGSVWVAHCRPLTVVLEIPAEKACLTAVAFGSLAEGIDATTPAGKLQMHILGAISEFERARCAERVRAGLARGRREGRRLGRPPVHVSREAVDSVRGLPVREAARRLGVSRSTAHRVLGQNPALQEVSQKP